VLPHRHWFPLVEPEKSRAARTGLLQWGRFGSNNDELVSVVSTNPLRETRLTCGFFVGEALAKRLQAGASRLWVLWRGTTPTGVNVLQLRRPLACLGHNCAMQTRDAKKRSPERGLMSLGAIYRVKLAGVQLEHYPSTTLPGITAITGTTPESFLSVILMSLKDSRTIGSTSICRS
jgi:hypothetical protein